MTHYFTDDHWDLLVRQPWMRFKRYDHLATSSSMTSYNRSTQCSSAQKRQPKPEERNFFFTVVNCSSTFSVFLLLQDRTF
ncbi:hypothetical protein M440DRAFT_1406667 [Trichoderma longibrachiatum ATCC 18648]|uniref:Uncharacterized protein n=1 Tax=Trichoderma longibrachiatum ATCC 18648 TaxID=983965 RepID=A0A2T4BPN6_TRILO|nr:hypothetical protein M440DRAFT_1406667 [Trichoderma longibrachiatum ATCC 18648]